jgi:hypothetical protein
MFWLEHTDGSKPKWLRFQCQRQGAAEGECCAIPINGQRNGSNASWRYTGHGMPGPTMTPTTEPSIRCIDSGCHFYITGGRFVYCGDHKGNRNG